jgi:hypothetical protein
VTTRTQAPSYEAERRRQLGAAIATRIHGVRLDGAHSLDGYFAIWYCGASPDGQSVRNAKKRIWHIPEDRVIASGILNDLTYEGSQVTWFDLHHDTEPIEESYRAVSLDTEILMNRLSSPREDGTLQSQQLSLTSASRRIGSIAPEWSHCRDYVAGEARAYARRLEETLAADGYDTRTVLMRSLINSARMERFQQGMDFCNMMDGGLLTPDFAR